MNKTGIDIDFAAECIQKGGLVVFPTETVYGLGANALNPLAVAKIFETKERPTFDPLIVHISDIGQLNELYEFPINNIVYKLAEKFWPGPLTIVYRKNKNISGIVTADLDTVAVRMPSHPVALSFITACKYPIAAPSANKFGRLSPTHHTHVLKQKMNIDYLLKGDNGIMGIESTVVFVDNNSCIILRPGIITLEQIKEVVSEVKFAEKKYINLPSPGLLKSHYSPRKPLYFIEKEDNSFSENTGLILHFRKASTINAGRIIYTSEANILVEVAANIFMALHKMEDDKNISEIYIEKVIEKGLGIAIMDRLKKACFQYSKT
ncbi:MAG: L-threonylcarbamoyladenylate synthase [Paludibacter sp.]|nr:L-threonylcarbamoyladenylate synthase [Paludibacter sp.]